MPPSPPSRPLLCWEHLLSRGPSREWPWTGADLAASPQSDVIRLSRKEKGWKSIHSPSRLRFGLRCTFKGIERTNRAVWGLFDFLCVFVRVQMCVCVFDWHKLLVSVCSHIKHDSQTNVEVAFGVVCSGERLHAWGGSYSLGLSFGFWWTVHCGLIVKRS